MPIFRPHPWKPATTAICPPRTNHLYRFLFPATKQVVPLLVVQAASTRPPSSLSGMLCAWPRSAPEGQGKTLRRQTQPLRITSKSKRKNRNHKDAKPDPPTPKSWSVIPTADPRGPGSDLESSPPASPPRRPTIADP